MVTLSLILLLFLSAPVAYLMLLALASARPPKSNRTERREPKSRFIIAIPAHDEENVIGATVRRLRSLDYPENLYSIHVVADYCSDRTAEVARQAEAVVHERNEGPRTGKGAALSWLFRKVLAEFPADGVVVFDADTRVDSQFLREMDARLSQGDRAIQGQHIISNPHMGWFPALTWAMFLVDNRFQNLGRSNLGWSAKNMGDSICFRADVLRELGWGEGLTEDYQFRQKLLLHGIRIVYEPAAKGYGEAPLTWLQARAQRARWLRGTRDASRQLAKSLIVEAIKRGDWALFDGALQANLPSYSTLTMVSLAILVIHLVVQFFVPVFPWSLLAGWAAIVALLFFYPLVGLLFENAPLKAYFAILTGPIFIVWRTWLAMNARFGKSPVTWIRTAHGGQN